MRDYDHLRDLLAVCEGVEPNLLKQKRCLIFPTSSDSFGFVLQLKGRLEKLL